MFIKKNYINKIGFINFFIALIPFSIALGNMAVNSNIVIISLIGLYIYRLDIFRLDKNIYKYLIYVFFFYLIANTLINNLPNLNNDILYKENLLKSFFFLRFLIFFLVIDKLIEKNNLNIKLFFISSIFFSSFLVIDIIIQLIFKKDLFGYVIVNNRPAGFFGDESIAGGYLQKFSLFTIFFLFWFFDGKKKFKIKFSIIFLFILIFLTTVLTANRMPIILLFSSYVLFFIMEKKIKIIISLFLFFSLMLVLLFKYPLTTRIDKDISNFYYQTSEIILNVPKLFFNKNSPVSKVDNSVSLNIGSNNPSLNDDVKLLFNSYFNQFYIGLKIWENNKIFGNGFKSFKLDKYPGVSAAFNTHPHNYTIEILVDTGIVGLVLIYLIFFMAMYNYLKFYNYNKNAKFRLLTVPFFLILFFEVLPFRSTGSFFSTGNAYIIFFVLAVVINVSKLKHSKI
jgi:hypothetical protein